jgi:hypothetical protein
MNGTVTAANQKTDLDLVEWNAPLRPGAERMEAGLDPLLAMVRGGFTAELRTGNADSMTNAHFGMLGIADPMQPPFARPAGVGYQRTPEAEGFCNAQPP